MGRIHRNWKSIFLVRTSDFTVKQTRLEHRKLKKKKNSLLSQWISTIYAGEKNPLPPLLITPLSAVALQSHVEGIGSSPGEGWGLAQTFLAAPSLIAVYL